MTAPTFVKHATAIVDGTPPQASAAFTPGANGNGLIVFTLDATTSTTTVTGTGAGTYGLVTPPGLNNDTDGDRWGVFFNPNASAVSQTFTVAGATFVGGVQLEFSGVSSISNGQYSNPTGIASGANILGKSQVIPQDSVLVALFISSTSATVAPTPKSAVGAPTTLWSLPTSAIGGFAVASYAGGQTITPTATSTETTGNFSVLQFLVNGIVPSYKTDDRGTTNRVGRGPYSKGRYFVRTRTDQGVKAGPAVYEVSIAEVGGAGDALATVLAALSALTAAGSSADSWQSILSALNTLTDSGAAADAATAGATWSNSVSDAGDAEDDAAAIPSWFRALTESGSASDTLAVVTLLAAVASEAASAADALDTLLGAVASLSESGSAADSATSSGTTYSLSVSDAGSAADDLAPQTVGVSLASEAGAAAAAIATLLDAINLAAEPGAATDSVSLGSIYLQDVSEAGAAAGPATYVLSSADAIAIAGSAEDALASLAMLVATATAIGAAAAALGSDAAFARAIAEVRSATDLVEVIADVILVPNTPWRRRFTTDAGGRRTFISNAGTVKKTSHE